MAAAVAVTEAVAAAVAKAETVAGKVAVEVAVEVVVEVAGVAAVAREATDSSAGDRKAETLLAATGCARNTNPHRRKYAAETRRMMSRVALDFEIELESEF